MVLEQPISKILQMILEYTIDTKPEIQTWKKTFMHVDETLQEFLNYVLKNNPKIKEEIEEFEVIDGAVLITYK